MPSPHTGDSSGHHNTTEDVYGTVVQVGRLQGDVRVSAPEALPTPQQLPPAPKLFTDREAEIRRLHDLSSAPSDGRLIVLRGTGGVGKTALATHFLKSVTDTFPDGILHADLLGFSGEEPADPSDLLNRFLRDLGVPPSAIPGDLPGRAAVFRSHTHGLRIALLLDNAASAAQIRPLLPGAGMHLVLVTTRLHLAGLRPDGAESVTVHPFDPESAAQLVERLLPDDRARTEPEAVHRLTALCGNLPLAVCAAVSGLVFRPHQRLSRLVARLTEEGGRIAELSTMPELSVDTVFTTSYRFLPAPVQRLYRLLGLVPGGEVTVDTAAALLDTSEEEAEDLLTVLLTASLLEEGPTERFRQHDLVRLHARALAEADDDTSDRETALDRTLEHLLRTAAAADHTLNPHRWHVAPVFEEPPARGFPSREAALTWFEEELDSLRACVRFAHDSGRHSQCWQLCEAMRGLFTLRRHYTAWEETHTLGLAAAEALADPAAQGSMSTALAVLHDALEHPDRARELHLRSLRLWERAENPHGQAVALDGLGTSEMIRGRPDRALGHFRRALTIHDSSAHARGITLMHRRLGECFRRLGDHTEAVTHLVHALRGFPASTEPYMRLRALQELAAAHVATAEAESANTSLEEAVELADTLGAPSEKAGVLALMAEVSLLRERVTEARERLDQALSIRVELADPRADETRRRLAELPPVPPRGEAHQ